ncbi:MAG: hypothetical protein U9Q82_09450, partial [Chloroflexota bacterium]|nr:hypothetical protein [Chloroflexota bacterium]
HIRTHVLIIILPRFICKWVKSHAESKRCHYDLLLIIDLIGIIPSKIPPLPNLPMKTLSGSVERITYYNEENGYSGCACWWAIGAPSPSRCGITK